MKNVKIEIKKANKMIKKIKYNFRKLILDMLPALNSTIILIIGSLVLLLSCSDDDDNSINNTAPLIENQTFSITNDAAIGTTAGKVLATDEDNDVLSYSITASNDDNIFAIDSTTGIITVSGALNPNTAYTLTVQVSDGQSNTDATITINLVEITVTFPPAPFSLFYDGTLIGADYWSETPEILSASYGFGDIIGLPGTEITQQLVEQAGGAWLSDVNCAAGNTASLTSSVTQQQLANGYILKTPYQQFLKDGALGLDGMPIVFSWPVLTNTVDINDVQVTLNTGEVVSPMAIGMLPNFENNERNCIVVFGEFGNRLPSTDPDARFSVRVEIVTGDTPLMLAGPNNQMVSAVGLSWETTRSPYDPNNGPRLVGAKLNHVGTQAIGEGVSNPIVNMQLPQNDEFDLYGGGDFRLRVLTSGGFSPDGVSGLLPTDYERFFRLHATGTDGSTVLIEDVGVDYQVEGGTLKVLGLSDLGNVAGYNGTVYGDCYAEDRDNYIDIIIEGDEDAARNITFVEIPSLEGGYDAFYNPGGPGTTPFDGVTYTQPGPRDLEPVIIALDNPMRVTN